MDASTAIRLETLSLRNSCNLKNPWALSKKVRMCCHVAHSVLMITPEGISMLNSLLSSIFGCAHNRTTFPLTPSRRSKISDGTRNGTYVVCLDCGKEFDYNWKEMRIGSPVDKLALHSEQHSVAH